MVGLSSLAARGVGTDRPGTGEDRRNPVVGSHTHDERHEKAAKSLPTVTPSPANNVPAAARTATGRRNCSSPCAPWPILPAPTLRYSEHPVIQ
ncbi:hypothetical protein RHA1_ro08255 (plasmid) [Rhodococcus jostii RHA1]|uniref:Uncharacterized protein n=2 Tax=Rhodococcus TaxID=1827 RepID=A0A2S2C520_9NOCA|nr:hypothetical protein RHA1_ro08255 [Rhodococcus jostii RHA1]AWK75997.1 hypothetical protein CBI38_30825 [Rhodococcus oxybenzonivorans]